MIQPNSDLEPAHDGASPLGHSPEGAPGTTEVPVTIIAPSSRWRWIDIGELWRYRELLFFLVWRDVKVRYKQTVLGAAWAVLQPSTMTLVLSLFFGRLAELASDRRPYPLYVFSGLVVWNFFANAMTQAAASVVSNQNMVTKVYFPRIVIPMGAIGACLVDLGINLGMLVALMACYGLFPGWGFLLLPVLLAALLAVAIGTGTLLAALTVAYRDFRHVVPFLAMLSFFATPNLYMHVDTVARNPQWGLNPRWEAVLPLNPVHGLVAGFRNIIFGDPFAEWHMYALTISWCVSMVLLVAGWWYFCRVERSFADII